VLRDNTVSRNARYGIYVKSEGNQIAGGNQVLGNAVGVYLNVAQPPDVSREANRIYDNREADVRIDNR
jgi:parallel beta-helix repeat protein